MLTQRHTDEGFHPTQSRVNSSWCWRHCPHRSTHSAGTLRIKEFLMRNGHPYSYVDLERDHDVQNLLDSFQISASEIPVLICRGQVVLRNPGNQQIADCLGFNESIDQTQVRDLVVIGAGPSGLAPASVCEFRRA